MGEIDLDFSFEDAMHELEKTIRLLESGDLSLEESMDQFEKGQRLIRLCNKYLEDASLKVEALTSDGEIVELDVDGVERSSN